MIKRLSDPDVKARIDAMTKEDSLRILKAIGALDTHREVTGTERDHLVTLFQMMEPVESSNNQHSWTDEYRIGDRVYHVHYFDGAEEALIEEYIKYKDD